MPFKIILKKVRSARLLAGLVMGVIGPFNSIHSQSKYAIDNGCIVKTKYQGKIRGSLVDQSPTLWIIADYTGDTIRVLPIEIRKVYLPEEITLFARKRFHYKKGGLLNHSLGNGLGGTHWNLSFNKRFTTKFEAGLGLGGHINWFYFSTSNSRHDVSVSSFPLYMQSKYIFSVGKKLWYGKMRAGWANNFNTFDTYDTKDGFLIEAGLGVTFKSKTRMKRYFEMTQYFSRASGMYRNTDINAISDIGFKVLFVNFMITYGVEIGR